LLLNTSLTEDSVMGIVSRRNSPNTMQDLAGDYAAALAAGFR
jgi:hypothetical protein